MTDKPVFLFWAHYKVWNVLTKSPWVDFNDAITLVSEEYNIQMSEECFAHLPGFEEQNGLTAPLDWGKGGKSGKESPLYKQWELAKKSSNWKRASTLAAQIRDLRLRKGAEKEYIVEWCYE